VNNAVAAFPSPSFRMIIGNIIIVVFVLVVEVCHDVDTEDLILDKSSQVK
jgi:hypothetical protein